MLDQIKNAVIETGKIMLEAENITENTHSREGHANFVTEYDTRAQKELFARLSAILPEAAFMGEEEETKTWSDKGFLFIIDPIDGTTNFIKQNHMICISAGLLKDGEPVLGIVYNPYRKELWKPAFEIAYHYFQKVLDLRRSGSAAIDLCDIACGSGITEEDLEYIRLRNRKLP